MYSLEHIKRIEKGFKDITEDIMNEKHPKTVIDFFYELDKKLRPKEKRWVLIQGMLGHGKSSLAYDIIERLSGDFDYCYYFVDVVDFADFIQNFLENASIHDSIPYVLLDDMGTDLDKWSRSILEKLLVKMMSLSRGFIRWIFITDTYLLSKWMRDLCEYYIVTNRINFNTSYVKAYYSYGSYEGTRKSKFLEHLYNINYRENFQNISDDKKRKKIMSYIGELHQKLDGKNKRYGGNKGITIKIYNRGNKKDKKSIYRQIEEAIKLTERIQNYDEDDEK